MKSLAKKCFGFQEEGVPCPTHISWLCPGSLSVSPLVSQVGYKYTVIRQIQGTEAGSRSREGQKEERCVLPLLLYFNGQHASLCGLRLCVTYTLASSWVLCGHLLISVNLSEALWTCQGLGWV